MRKYALIMLFGLICITNVKVQAQVVQSAAITITVPTVLNLSITSGQNPVAQLNTTALIDNGKTLPNATIFKYSSNQAFHVSIAAATANFGGNSPTTMPASVVKYRLNGTSNSFVALSTTAASLDGTSASPVPRGVNTIGVDFLINPGYIYAPATDYTLTINYTISNP